MNTTSYKINESLFLVQQQVGKEVAKPAAVEVPTNHLLVIDCSGSMWGELTKIATQLKAKLPKILKEEDTVSIIWFSGRGQCDALLEGERVSNLAELQTINQQIDRWLRPIGMTGFKEPLQLVSKVVDKVAKKAAKGSAFSLYFLTDGCDNQWSRPDILKAVEEAGSKVQSSTFVEYGYYADRNLLTQMAEKCGGVLIFAEDFDRYAPSIEAAMQKKTTGAKRIEVKIPGDPINGFAFAMTDGDLTAYAVEDGAVKVPEDLAELWYVAPKAEGGKPEPFDHKGQGRRTGAAYAALSLYAQRMNSNVVFALLKLTGDVQYIDQFANCFGKQKYSDFTEATRNAAFNAALRLVNGYDPKKIPPDDAFTILDLLRVLSSDEGNRILLDSKDFKYSKMSRGRVDADTQLTPEEQEQIAKLTAEMVKTKDAKKIAKLSADIVAVTANKPAPLKFELDKQPDGYPISTLTYNEDRPNINFLVRKTGTVDLSSRTPPSTLPKVFPTHIFRNYNVIKDGLVGLDRLPVRLTAGTIRALKAAGMPIEAIVNPEGETLEETRTRVKKAGDDREVNVVFDLKVLPIINRKMVKEVSAKKLFETEWELTKARAAQKVYNSYLKEKATPGGSKGLIEQYGQEAADWLKEQGFGDNGFAPKQVQAESTDVYMGKVLEVKLKGYATLPSLNEARKKLASGKPNPPTALMKPAIDEVEAFLKVSKSDAELVAWLETKKKEATTKVRELIYTMAQIKFGIVVGQTWPLEFKSLDENSLDLEIDGLKLSFSLIQSEEEIKI
jgi:hypothetical protein